MVRFAFTLIELIFAIVVIGISVISLPMMTQATSKAIDGNILQEAIFASAAELNQAVAAHWDEASLDSTSFNVFSEVIDDGTCDNNPSSPTYRQKQGHINQPKHRKCLNDSTVTVTNASIDGNITALDDMEKTNQDLFINMTPDQAGYKNEYTTTVTVNQNPVFNGSANANMKSINVSVSYKGGSVITSLVTYSANIGEVDYYKRSY